MDEQKDTLSIIEWQEFNKNDIEKELKESKEFKAQKIFEELKSFASEEKNRNFIIITKGGKSLKARNYVGMLQTKSGFCLEILPKTIDKESPKTKEIESAKDLLISMLKTLRNFPFKTSNISNLSITKNSLLDIFTQMFLNELLILIKKGIKSDYQATQENCLYLKGKLLFSQHIKYNFAHQERFYTLNDEYSPNIPQNALIASTLALLSKLNLSTKSQALLRECHFVFKDIAPSKNIDKDFQACSNNKSLKHYAFIIAWCKVFLKKQSFTPYAGNSLAMALLFDMNQLFESYVAYHLKRHCKNWEIKIQNSEKYLLQGVNGNFSKLCPDVVAKHKTNENKIIILDTKWKKIASQKDIDSADIYQMWAYASKYQSQKAILLYPKITEFKKISFDFKPQIHTQRQEKARKISLKILFIDLQKDKTKEKENEKDKTKKN